MAAQNNVSGSINFNVGGRLFTTSKLTLLQDSGSFFARMLEGDWLETVTNGQTIFIDRDPDSFSFILRWLRSNGNITMPTDHTLVQTLVSDAQFYQLDYLLKTLQRSGAVLPAALLNQPDPIPVIYFELVNSYRRVAEEFNVSFDTLKKHCGGGGSYFIRKLLSGNRGFSYETSIQVELCNVSTFHIVVSLLKLGYVSEAFVAHIDFPDSCVMTNAIHSASRFLIDNEMTDLVRELDKYELVVREFLYKKQQ